jgi:beta-glucosidase
MATQSYVLCLLILGLVASNIVASTTPSHEIHSFNRQSFPPGFIFGAASAAYQVIFSLSLPSIIVILLHV